MGKMKPVNDSTPDYVNAYRKVLKEFKDSDKNQYEDPAFTLAYIDDDDIPELLITDTYAKVGLVYIYTYNVNEAVLIDTTGSNGVIYYQERSGLFVTVDEDMYCSSITALRMNATITEQVWCGRTERKINDDTIKYFSDNEEVDEVTYKAFLNEYKPEESLSNLDGYPLTDENIKTAIKQSRASS